MRSTFHNAYIKNAIFSLSVLIISLLTSWIFQDMMIMVIGIIISIYFLYIIESIREIAKKENYHVLEGTIQKYEKKAKVSAVIPKIISNECCLTITTEGEKINFSLPRFELSIYKMINKDKTELIGKKIRFYYREGDEKPFYFSIERGSDGK